MFVKKLVEKASKKPGGNDGGVKANEVEPRLVFHYGIPSSSTIFAYHPSQNILAIATADARIKLFGRYNTQALLQSPDDKARTTFLQFVRNHRFLLNVTSNSHIEFWDVDKRQLCHVDVFKHEITAFQVMRCAPYIYVGDSSGNISILKIEQNPPLLVLLKYSIPYSVSNGNPAEGFEDTAIVNVLPQPAAESKRVLIVFRSGLISLWDLRESKSIFKSGGTAMQSLHAETKKATCACWVCPLGSKAAVGYLSGDILIWSIPSASNIKTEGLGGSNTQNSPICKLNLGYKSEKIPIASLKWACGDGKASRLYVIGASTELLQVVLLNEHTESRIVKMGLHVPEPCIDMEIATDFKNQDKHKQVFLFLLGKWGRVYAYEDYLIEKYLLQSQSRSPPSLPKEILVRMPFAESLVTAAQIITNSPHLLNISDEEYFALAKEVPSLPPFQTAAKDGARSSSTHFSGFTTIRNLFIAGHSDGTISFWDITCPMLIPIFSTKQQNEDDNASDRASLTALHYDSNARLLVSGDQNGTVRFYSFKQEPYATDNSFMPFQGSTKKLNSHIIHIVKSIKINGSITCLNVKQGSKQLAVGSDRGYVALVDVEGLTIQSHKSFASEICPAIVSLQFANCSLHGFDKNVLVVATKDSSILAIDADNGNMFGSGMIRPKKPSNALFMRILDGDPSTSDGPRSNAGSLVQDAMTKQASVLLCSEKAAYIYSLSHIVQGVKKVHCKKKFNSSLCCWASTFCCVSGVGLVLLFTSGRLEVRSLPDLTLLKETSVRGFGCSSTKSNSLGDFTICSSKDGDIVMVNSDQELFVLSVMEQKETLRILDRITQVYRKENEICPDNLVSGSTLPKEKKKGIFGSVFKDMTASKGKHAEVEAEDTIESIEELAATFLTPNFPCSPESRVNPAGKEDDSDLDIDDIDIEEPREHYKEQSMLPGINKQKLVDKFQSLKGKLKQIKAKNERNTNREEQKGEKTDTVDQVKRKYGVPVSGETSAAKMAESKLTENLKKLQGINLKTTEMQDSAKSFSSLAEQLLQTVEHDQPKL